MYRGFKSIESVELLLLVPVPFVHLAFLETKLLGNFLDVLASPVGILFEFYLQLLELVLVFSLAALYFFVSTVVFRFSDKSSHAFV